MLSTLSTFQSLNSYIADANSAVALPSGPTQSYGGSFSGSMSTGTGTATPATRYLSVDTAQSIGTSKFTIEFWIYLTQNTTGQGVFGTKYSSNNKNIGRHTAWFNFPGNIGKILFQNGDTAAQSLVTETMALNTWHHVAITRDSSNVCRIFTNGVLGATTRTWTTNFADNQYAVGRAYRDLNQECIDRGYLTGFSISKECYYTTSFTPTRQKLNSDSTKTLLLNFNSSGALLTDSSPSNNTVTNNNAMVYSSTFPA